MRTVLVTFLTILMLLPVSAMGEILTIRHSVKQTFGGGQSPDDARISGIALAKREALEKAGTYIESLTVVKNSKVEKDEILALTAGVLKAEVISQKNYTTDDAFGIEIVVNVIVDTSVLEERVKKQLQDREHLTQLKDTQKREKELLQKVAKLEDENRKLSAEKQSTEKLKKEFQQASQGLTAVEWVNKALALWDGNKNADPKKAIEYLNNAIKLKPDYTEAYGLRGAVYNILGQYQRAIEDCNEAIRLKPDSYIAYYLRAAVYNILGQYQRTIEDCNQAIHLKPDWDAAYSLRGGAYLDLGQYQRAIEDCNQAIRLKPDSANDYSNRGGAYVSLGQYQRAIEDFNIAIRLKPDSAYAYYVRGGIYLKQGNKKLGCRDAQKACSLGNCKMLEEAKDKGLCL